MPSSFEEEEDEGEYDSEERSHSGGQQHRGPAPTSSSNPQHSVDDNTLRIMLSTDNHLGYAEKDPVRGMDSFAAFEEVLYLAKRFRCDMVLIAGDLFHENRPTRHTLHKTMEIIRRYCLGQDPVQLRILSDPRKTFQSGTVNYLDENISVDLPVFSIHGNHDDPTRDVAGETLAALDLLSVTYLVNYFGRQDAIDNVEVSPVLLQKGDTKLALYGLGSMRDERLHRMWTQGKVKFMRPEDDEEFFSLFALHQNRDLGRGNKNCIREDMIPEWMDVVVWGHEHECQIEFQESVTGTFRISQPGSSVATSLIVGESVQKKVGVLDVQYRDGESHFRLSPIPLTQVRGFVTTELSLKNHRARLDPEDPKIDAKVSAILEEEVRLMILNARDKTRDLIEAALLAGSDAGGYDNNNNNDPSNAGKYALTSRLIKPEQVLVRIKVDHSGFSTLNNQRFGGQFVGQVANPGDILLFSRRRDPAALAADASNRSSNQKLAASLLSSTAVPPDELDQLRLEHLVMQLLDGPGRSLHILDKVELSEAVEEYVHKSTVSAIPDATIKMLTRKQKELAKRSLDDDDDCSMEKGSQIRQLIEDESRIANEKALSKKKNLSNNNNSDPLPNNDDRNHSNDKGNRNRTSDDDSDSDDAAAVIQTSKQQSTDRNIRSATAMRGDFNRTATVRLKHPSSEEKDDSMDDSDDNDDLENEKRGSAVKPRGRTAAGSTARPPASSSSLSNHRPTRQRLQQSTRKRPNYAMEKDDGEDEFNNNNDYDDDSDEYVAHRGDDNGDDDIQMDVDCDDDEDEEEKLPKSKRGRKTSAAPTKGRKPAGSRTSPRASKNNKPTSTTTASAAKSRSRTTTTAGTTAHRQKTTASSRAKLTQIHDDSDDDIEIVQVRPSQNRGGKKGGVRDDGSDDDWGTAATRSQF